MGVPGPFKLGDPGLASRHPRSAAMLSEPLRGSRLARHSGHGTLSQQVGGCWTRSRGRHYLCPSARTARRVLAGGRVAGDRSRRITATSLAHAWRACATNYILCDSFAPLPRTGPWLLGNDPYAPPRGGPRPCVLVLSQLEGARHHHGDSATSPSPWLGRCRAAPFPGTRLPRSGSDSIAALQGAGGMLALLGGPHGGSTYW